MSNPDEVLLHEIALAWGCSINEVQQRIGSREWTRWRAFYTVRPFGEKGADLRAGVIAAGIVNAIKNKALVAPIDFMPVIVNLMGGPLKVKAERLKQKTKAVLDWFRTKKV